MPAGCSPAPSRTTALTNFFQFVWPPTFPASPYTFFLVLTPPDALPDGRGDIGDLIVIGTQTITFAP